MARFGEPYLRPEQVVLGQSLQSVTRSTFSQIPLLRWEVDNKSSVWDDYAPIREEINDYLQNHHRLRAGGARCSLCFVGYSRSQLKAAIVIHCEDKRCYSMAKHIIGHSSEWRLFKKEHPTFELMTAPKAPAPRALPTEGDYFDVYGTKSEALSIGATVSFRSAASVQVPNGAASARVGPTIFHQGQPYVITVSHQFRNLSRNDWGTDPQPLDDTTYELEDDVWDMFDEDDNGITSATPPGSDSPTSESLSIMSNTKDASLFMDSDFNTESDALIERMTSPLSVSEHSTDFLERSSVDVEDEAAEISTIVGEVILRSRELPSKQHDWALIKPSPAIAERLNHGNFLNTVPGLGISPRPLKVSQVAPRPRSYKFVWLATSTEQCEEAKLSGSVCSYRLPGTYKLLDVLPLHMSRPLALGESGTAVIDPEDGSWCGHIIAAEEAENIAYVLPADGVMESIAHSLGVQTDSLSLTQSSESESSSLAAQVALNGELFYSHKPLRSGQIRLLYLDNIEHDGGEAIQATLEHYCIDDAPRYRALSYAWGSTALDHTIYVDGKRLMITAYLEEALRYLRLVSECSILWIDAVCIDQNNNEEKADQVNVMGQIYRTASEVIAWLGPRDTDTDLAIDCIERMSASRWSWSLHEPGLWSAICRLLDRPYFRRIWVLQEVSLAKRVVCLYGDRQISWKLLKSITSFGSSAHETALSTAIKQRDRNLVAQLLDASEESYHATSLDPGVLLLPESRSLADLLFCSSRLQCSDPRDRIYALLALTEEPTLIKPDYSKPVFALYAQVFDHIIHHSGSLDILLRPWIPEHEASSDSPLPSWMPTWVPSWSWTSLDSHLDFSALHKRLDGSSQLKSMIPAHTMTRKDRRPYSLPLQQFHAGGSARSHQHNKSNSAFDPAVLVTRQEEIAQARRTMYSLRCSAKIFGSLKYLSDEGTRSLSFSAPVRLFAKQKDSDDYESLWKTLVAGCDATDQRPPPIWYGDALADILGNESRGPNDIRSLLDLASDGSALRLLFQRIETVMSRRRLGVLETVGDRVLSHRGASKHMLALIPEEAKVEDFICVLLGCSVPLVLRKQRSKASRMSEDVYTVVGESYVHGIMDGELLSDPAFPVKTITLI